MLNTGLLKVPRQTAESARVFQADRRPEKHQDRETPDTDDRVDIILKVEEQNRNSVQFGAGVSQYEGLFGNVSYTCSTGRSAGRSISIRTSTITTQGARPRCRHQPRCFTAKYARGPPGLWDGRWRVRQLYLRSDRRLHQRRLAWRVRAAGTTAGTSLFNPYLDQSRHIDSRITPSLVYNTVDSPIMAHTGMRISGGLQLAGARLQGSYHYLKPEIEVIKYLPTSRRTCFVSGAAPVRCEPMATRRRSRTTCGISSVASIKSEESTFAPSVPLISRIALSAATSSCCSMPSDTAVFSVTPSINANATNKNVELTFPVSVASASGKSSRRQAESSRRRPAARSNTMNR